VSGAASAINIMDLRSAAEARLPRMILDYIDGGADDELSLRWNRERLRAHRLVWDALVDVGTLSARTRILGAEAALPLILAPTAASRLFHPEQGELAVARAAATMGVPYAVSTLASTTVEAIAKANPGPKFFQIYVWRDRGLVVEVMARAKQAGFTAAILTVDLPVTGNRERDPRNRFTIPPKLNGTVLRQMLERPGFLWRMTTTRPIKPENVPFKGQVGSLTDFVARQFDPTMTWRDAEWMVREWGGPFAVKGIATPEDARRAIAIGASAVWVSNHGGRQLDTAPATIDTLSGIADAVRGEAEIVIDGGFTRGADIAKALCLGANAVAIGKAYLYGLAAGGEAGVLRALAILAEEFKRTLALMGAPDIRALSPRFVLPPV